MLTLGNDACRIPRKLKGGKKERIEIFHVRTFHVEDRQNFIILIPDACGGKTFLWINFLTALKALRTNEALCFILIFFSIE